MPDSKPDLTFNQRGVCSACQAFEMRPAIDWDDRRKALETLLSKFRSKDGYWDCVIPVNGVMNGYDLDNLRTVVEAVRIPVVVSGGAGNLSHFAPAILEGGASAVGVGSIFLFTHTTPSEVRDELGRNGIPVRASVK